MHKKRLIPHCQCHLPRPLLEPICELSLLVVLPSLVERQSGGRIVRARKTTKSSGNFKASSHFISFSCLRTQGIQHFKTSVGIQVPCRFLLQRWVPNALRFGVHQGQSSNRRGALIYCCHDYSEYSYQGLAIPVSPSWCLPS